MLLGQRNRVFSHNCLARRCMSCHEDAVVLLQSVDRPLLEVIELEWVGDRGRGDHLFEPGHVDLVLLVVECFRTSPGAANSARVSGALLLQANQGKGLKVMSVDLGKIRGILEDQVYFISHCWLFFLFFFLTNATNHVDLFILLVKHILQVFLDFLPLSLIF